MGICACGKSVKENRLRCTRCAALQVFGLNAGANEKEIRSAYLRQVKKWHPDRFAKDRSQQQVADEKLKRINLVYKRLTSPPKGRGVSSQSSSTSSDIPRSKRPRSAVPQHNARGKQEQTPKTEINRSVRPQPSSQAKTGYPQYDFTKWEARFNKQSINGTNAGRGLKKWISHMADQCASNIAFYKNSAKSHGVDPTNPTYITGLKSLQMPEDERADSIRRLWYKSAPNVEERNRAASDLAQLLKQMEQLADSVKELGIRLQSQRSMLMTQDGFFEIPLTGMPELCITLSSSLRKSATLARRKYIYPIDIADCCTPLVFEMEDRCGLSQKECHALIRCALLAHGCTEDEVRPFDEELIDRGTIGAKKEALIAKVLKSANYLYGESRKS